MPRWLFPLVLGLLAPTTARAAKPPTRADEVFGLTNVWPMHLTIPAKEWAKMEPTRGGFQRPPRTPLPPDTPDRKPRGGFGFDFEYVKADLTIDGHLLKDVGVRFKGNSSYMVAARHLKRPFKVDLDRQLREQTWGGLRKLTLNNLVMDPTVAREALSFAVYRAAGVPAPRTAFVQLSITVPGKYDKAFVGLYALIETVDSTFLKDRFGESKGLLLKPERVGPLDFLGEQWSAYESRYRPKAPASKADQQRLIEFIKLVQQADEARFRKEISSFLDLDLFLRYLAATVALSSMDSFVGLGHNYYLYLDPKRNKFVFLPWDTDHSFGALLMFGSANDLVELSIRQPYPGRNRLVERLLADEKVFASYKKHLEQLLDKAFTSDGIKNDLAIIKKVVSASKEQERKAVSERSEGWNTWLLLGMFNRPLDPDVFATRRIAAIRAQLDGKSTGKVLRPGFGPPPGPERLLVRPLVTAADTDKDRRVSRDEALAGARTLFVTCDKENKGELDEKRMAQALEKLLPRPGMFGGPPSLAGPVARGIFARAGNEGKLTADALVVAAGKAFDKADKDKNGKLDERELTEALREVLSPATRPDPTKKEKGMR
jgi:spore coat protein CotH